MPSRFDPTRSSPLLLYAREYNIFERMGELMQKVREAVPAVASLPPAGLIDIMAELHRVESVLVERKLAVIAALAEHRLCEAAREEIDCGAEVAETEVGAALTVRRAG